MIDPMIRSLVLAALPVLERELNRLPPDEQQRVKAMADDGHRLTLQLSVVDKALAIALVVTDVEGEVTERLHQLGFDAPGH